MTDETLPTREEIAKLPRWVRVAFAARCARRALPLFKKHWPNAPEKHLTAVEQAVRVAETASAAARAVYDPASSASFASAASAAPLTGYAVYAAIAADAAAHAAITDTALIVTTAANSAAIAAARAGVPVRAIRSDFDTVQKLAQRSQWTDHTPVPSSVFGPLDEPAVDVAKPVQRDSQLKLSVYLGPTADPDAVGDKLVELYEALNDLSIEKYGKGLTVKEFEQLVPTLVPAPTSGR